MVTVVLLLALATQSKIRNDGTKIAKCHEAANMAIEITFTKLAHAMNVSVETCWCGSVQVTRQMIGMMKRR